MAGNFVFSPLERTLAISLGIYSEAGIVTKPRLKNVGNDKSKAFACPRTSTNLKVFRLYKRTFDASYLWAMKNFIPNPNWNIQERENSYLNSHCQPHKCLYI
ncbi:hypothetical protein LC612_08295 [Nostoc sp. CHAB 5834]|nr:hypothetical protein [Nostoc sp. CHAB 5834]